MQLVIGQDGGVYHPEVLGSAPLRALRKNPWGHPCLKTFGLAKAGGDRRDLVPWCAQGHSTLPKRKDR